MRRLHLQLLSTWRINQLNGSRNSFHPLANNPHFSEKRGQCPHDPMGHATHPQGKGCTSGHHAHIRAADAPQVGGPTHNTDDQTAIQQNKTKFHGRIKPHFLLKGQTRLFNCLYPIVQLLIILGEHFDRMNIGVAVHHPPGHGTARIRRRRRCRANAPHSPNDQSEIEPRPHRKGDH